MINIFDDVLPDSYWKKMSEDFCNYPKIELVEKLIKLEKENLHLQYVCRECLTIFRKLNEDMEKYNEH